MEFDLQVPRGASLGVYGRRNAIPTLTLNDVSDVITGYRAREGRAASMANSVSSSVM